MTPTRFVERRFLMAGLAAATLLAACGGGVAEEQAHDHENIRIDTAGRLAVVEEGAVTLRIHDLDSGMVEASHVMQASPSAVYASPGGRYAVVPQRLQDRVQFVDGGIFQEDHGDHLHDYKQASKAVSFTLTGSRPTHYDVQAGMQAAVYFDGDGTATPAVNAGVSLLTVTRASDTSDTLPTHLNLHQRSGSAYSFVRQLPTRCNGMHGSFSSGSSTLVGCVDGMMLVNSLAGAVVTRRDLGYVPSALAWLGITR